MATFRQAMEYLGYTVKTTLWDDFSVAELFGTDKIQEEYDNAFGKYKDSVVEFTELVLVLNHKIWQHYNAGNEEIARKYNELWETADTYGLDNFKDDELQYFIRTLD